MVLNSPQGAWQRVHGVAWCNFEIFDLPAQTRFLFGPSIKAFTHWSIKFNGVLLRAASGFFWKVIFINTYIFIH